MDHEKAKADLRTLLAEAKNIFQDEMIKVLPTQAKKAGMDTLSAGANISTAQRYHIWYSKILPFIRYLGPDRLREFVSLYELDPKRKGADWLHYTLQDYIRGTMNENFEPISAFASLFQQQIMIVEAIYLTADQRLSDLEQVIRADVFHHEIDAAENLLKNKHLRAAGALSGVTLEFHLRKVCEERKIEIKKKTATISDYNDLLKANSVIDVPVWRQLQRLGDIRNLCVHAKEREPTRDEVVDLISGTRKALAEIL
jgi:hypothetical protein